MDWLPQWLSGKEPAFIAIDAGDVALILGREDPLEKETATHFRILAWRIPWTVQFMGSQRVGHD